MLDVNINLFQISLEGRSFPGVLTRMREIVWAWLHCHEFVRYSISAMVRIQVDDKYLLIKNRHFGKHQPVGGALKRLPHSEQTFRDLGVREDNMFAPDEINRGDLRVQVPAKSIPGFLDWYASGHGREIGPWREFYEELVRPGIVSANVFPHIQVQHIRRHNTGIARARHVNDGARFECRIAEIFDLVPTEEQRAILIALVKVHDGRVMWATAEEIATLGVIPKKQPEAVIAETASWIV